MLKNIIITSLMTAAFLAAPLESSAASEPVHIVTVGDSITAGSAEGNYPALLDDQLDSAVVTNVGHGGQCVVRTVCAGRRLLDTFKSEALTLRPDIIIVGIGVNDVCGVTSFQIKDAYRKLARRADRRGVEIYFNTITPYGPTWPWPCEVGRIEINDWIRTQPNVIDMAAALERRDGTLAWRFNSGDGLHPNAAGFAAMADAAARVLR